MDCGLVRVPRFELGASGTPFKRDTKLRHTRLSAQDSLSQRLVYISIPPGKMQAFFKIFSKFFEIRIMLRKLTKYNCICNFFERKKLLREEFPGGVHLFCGYKQLIKPGEHIPSLPIHHPRLFQLGQTLEPAGIFH